MRTDGPASSSASTIDQRRDQVRHLADTNAGPTTPPPLDPNAVLADAALDPAGGAIDGPEGTPAAPIAQAEKTRDTVAGAAVDNERGKTAASQLKTARDAGAPTLPVADVEGVDPLADVDAIPVPETEPTAEHRALANGFRDRLQRIDDVEADPRLQAEDIRAGNFETPNRQRSAVLREVADAAGAITDLAERDRFVRAVALDVGAAAGRMALSSPSSAVAALTAIGEGATPATGALLANEAIRTGNFENLVPLGISGTVVGDALVAQRDQRIERLGEVAGNVATTVVPGVDAAVRLREGDIGGAIVSGGVDLLGGALIKGGRLAVGAATVLGAGVLLAPTEAEAGVGAVIRQAMRFGDNAVDVVGHTGLNGGRRQTFDVAVTGAFRDGSRGTLRLVDERAKHTQLSTLSDESLSRLARDVSRGRQPELAITRREAQFASRYNTVEGQARLAAEVMRQVSPADLARIADGGTGPIIQLDRAIGLTPTRGGQVVPATSVRILSSGDGAFHLVPMP